MGLCQGCPTHPLWVILDVTACGSIHNPSGQGGLPAASCGLDAAPSSAMPPLGEASVPRAMQDFGISRVWSGTGTDTKEQAVLLGQAETDQRTLAKIRPQQSLKMGLREIVPHALAFRSSWVGRTRHSRVTGSWCWHSSPTTWDSSYSSPKCFPFLCTFLHEKLLSPHLLIGAAHLGTWMMVRPCKKRPEGCPMAVPGLHGAQELHGQ